MLPKAPFSSPTTSMKSIRFIQLRVYSLTLASNFARFFAWFSFCSSFKKGCIAASIAYLNGAPPTSSMAPCALLNWLPIIPILPRPPISIPIGLPASDIACPLSFSDWFCWSANLVPWNIPSPRPDIARPIPPTIPAVAPAPIPPADAAALVPPPPSKALIPRPVSSKSNPPSSIPSGSKPPPLSSPPPSPSPFFSWGPLVSARPATSFVLSSFLSALANFASSNAFLLNSVCASTDSLIIVRDPVVLVDCSRLALDNDWMPSILARIAVVSLMTAVKPPAINSFSFALPSAPPVSDGAFTCCAVSGDFLFQSNCLAQPAFAFFDLVGLNLLPSADLNRDPFLGSIPFSCAFSLSSFASCAASRIFAPILAAIFNTPGPCPASVGVTVPAAIVSTYPLDI